MAENIGKRIRIVNVRCGTFRCVTWVDFPVVSDSVGVHDVLEAGGELVGLVEGGRSLFGQHPVQDGGHGGATPLLSITTNMAVWSLRFDIFCLDTKITLCTCLMDRPH